MSNGIENSFMDSSFFDKIKYKKVRVRLVKKEGKTYVKYAMVPRFKTGKSVKLGVLCFFILVSVALALFCGLFSGCDSPRKAGIEWVTIPGGTFMMGAEDWPDAKPRHSVTVKTFQMAKTEATNKQYRICVEAGACAPPSSYVGDADQPVVNVDWSQAKAFSEWAGGRLPSEAEWEYAARSAGKERKYPWGDEEPSCEYAVMNKGGDGCGRNTAWPVCSKTAGNTEQGLCDLAGNVWEWTQDWYHNSYNSAPTDGSAWESPTGAARVFRGGSWGNDDTMYFRAAYRYSFGLGYRSGNLGVRPAR